MTYNKRKNTLLQKAQEDDDDTEQGMDFIQYSNSSLTLSKLTVYLDEPIREAKYYRPLIEHMNQLSQEDCVEFKIDSPGGNLAGAIALINAMYQSEAEIQVTITGQCASACTLIALSAPSVRLYEHSYMMFHSAAFGSVGKQENVEGHVSFMSPKIRSIISSTYKDFLTDKEIDDMNKGLELWLDTEEINRRLEQREKIQRERFVQDQQAKLKEPEVKPKVKSKRKPKESQE